MPRIRKPTATLVALGSRHAATRRAEPATGREIGEPPEWLTAEAAACWRELVADVAPGVFESSDRLFLALLSTTLANFRADPVGFGAKRHALLLGMLSRAGMTPADRSRVAVAPRAPPTRPTSGLASFRGDM